MKLFLRKLFVWSIYLIVLIPAVIIAIAWNGLKSTREVFQEIRSLDPDGEGSRLRTLADKVFGQEKMRIWS